VNQTRIPADLAPASAVDIAVHATPIGSIWRWPSWPGPV